MTVDFLELLNTAPLDGDGTAADTIGSSEAGSSVIDAGGTVDAIDERVRRVLFECLFSGLSDERVASLFRVIGWPDGFDCYAIAGYPAQSAIRCRTDIERIVTDFAGNCLTAEYAMPINGGIGAERMTRAQTDDSRQPSADQPHTGQTTADQTVIVALVRPVGAATPEVICNSVAVAFDGNRPLALGPTLAGADGARQSISTALFCLKAAPALTATVQQLPRPLRAMDALPERALIGDTSARDELVNVVYGSLAAAGSDDPTLTTVSTFLKFGGSLEACAKALNVHPNTIRYRLKRAAETTGWDATDPREAYVLTCAIALGHIQSAH
ncbi:PucR family transcriptional regulator [Bifidobacterium oedipodis]|uniref:Polyketide synthase regulator n=1 Tax=Bifidobacterium oedipodis TaxID=2675322 RepID=A0A7Y0HTW7_9BIFI|nr:helix-turn-helix domain-containing protein [Bifidobacterium sp. DSM 109957]NMM95028.1 polyketide synthase regulator [Bifidobacterium sp. DSM 109957]